LVCCVECDAKQDILVAVQKDMRNIGCSERLGWIYVNGNPGNGFLLHYAYNNNNNNTMIYNLSLGLALSPPSTLSSDFMVLCKCLKKLYLLHFTL